MRNKKSKIALMVIFVVCVLIYFFVPSINKGVTKAISTLSSLGVEGVVEYIRGYGAYAVIISFLLMVLQSIIAPIPAFVITLSNAVIFGWVKGAILSWSSAMVGASMCFYISRILGRDVVEKLNSKGALKNIDVFFEKYGNYAILVARLLPFVSFDLVSYAAGLTSMNFASFFIATGIGQLPATIVYSYVGGTLTGGAKALMMGLLILFSLSIIIFVGKKIYDEKQKNTN